MFFAVLFNMSLEARSPLFPDGIAFLVSILQEQYKVKAIVSWTHSVWGLWGWEAEMKVDNHSTLMAITKHKDSTE